MIDTIINNHSLYLLQSIQLDKLENKIAKKQEYIDQLSKLYNNINSYGLTKQFASIIPFFSKDYTTSNLLKSFSLTNGKNYLEGKELKETILNNIKKEKEELKVLEKQFNDNIQIINLNQPSIFNNKIPEYLELSNEEIEKESFVDKVKKFFKWLFKKLQEFYIKAKNYLLKLLLKLKPKENTVDVDEDGIENIKKVLQTNTYKVLPLDQYTQVNKIHKEVISGCEKIITQLKSEKLQDSEIEELLKDKSLIKIMFDHNLVNINNINENIISYINGSSNNYSEDKLAIDIIKNIDPSFSINSLSEKNIKETYNSLYKYFQDYADKIFKESEYTLSIIKSIITYSFIQKNEYVGISQRNNVSYQVLYSSFKMIETRFNTLLSNSTGQYLKLFHDVLFTFEKNFKNEITSKSVQMKQIEIIEEAIKEANPAGTINGIHYFFIDDLPKTFDLMDYDELIAGFKYNKEINEAMDRAPEFLQKTVGKLLKVFQVNAFCCTIEGLTDPIIITTKYLKSLLTDEEFKFILYHEVGHARNNHATKLTTILNRFAVSTDKYPLGLLLKLSLGLGARNNYEEYEADAFGIEHTSPDTAITALIKLSKAMALTYPGSLIQRYLSDINGRINFAKKWKKLGHMPELPKNHFKKYK